MRITFVISSLGGGGAERVVSNMARYWAEKGWEITILTLFQGHQPLCYDLSPKVIHRDLLSTTLSSNPRPDANSLVALRGIFKVLSPCERRVFLRDMVLIVALRQAIIKTHPQIVISFIDVTNIYVLLALQQSNLSVIVSERCDPRQVSTGDEGWDRLRHRLYPGATRLVVLDEESLSYFSAEIRQRSRVIPNAVLPPRYTAAGVPKRAQTVGKTLLAMGRLEGEKGLDLLLHAFAGIARKHPSWSLDIWGQGPLEFALKALADELGLSERVRFRGFTKQPYDVMQRADLFVLSSRYEGFPNVLLEAMACGLPVVSFNCPTGPNQIIREGIDGVLVPPCDVGALMASLDHLMSNDTERQRLADRAPEVIERFSIERVMRIWENLIRECYENN
jgi:GalNAc-alpha-(1->4)-GalNAc-alpha-(1->3)-diNAcBac-PP-undecaprenol alpha-1,4-N-acetyl-D-galactosaminyltransferase